MARVSLTSTTIRAIAAVGVVVAAVIVALVTLSDGGLPDRDPPPAPPPSGRPLPASEPGRATGYVRELSGAPIAGARVKLVGSDASARSDESGRYELDLPAATGTLEASAGAHAAQQVKLQRPPPGQGERVDYTLARTSSGGLPEGANSADRVVLWAGCDRIAALSAAEVDRWIKRGIDGFVCSAGRLRSMGGEHEFTRDAGRATDGDGYALQRRLRGSAVVKQARQGRLKLYLGFYASDFNNEQTPFKEWFDDQAWSQEVIPQVRGLAAAARSLDFAGVAIDQELYPGGGGEPSWSWNYPGHTRSEAETRERVTSRGRELMQAFVSAYPGLEIVAYATQLRDSWEDKVQEVVNNKPDSFDSDVRLDLWNGMTSVQGYSAIWWLDAIFYKIPHLGKGWEPGLQYNASSVYSMLSRNFSNWRYASQRLHLTPFAWIDKGPSSEFERAREPAYVDEQLAAFRKWGTGGAFGIFAFGEFGKFDYGPYEDAIQGSSAPATVDKQPPRLELTEPSSGNRVEARGDRRRITGSASDNFAIRVVRWYDERGRFGTAKLEWQERGSPTSGYDSATTWSIDDLPVDRSPNRITIVAEDIKGLATTRVLTAGR